jgi:E3 ubiquitin-protein ligase TRIP12
MVSGKRFGFTTDDMKRNCAFEDGYAENAKEVEWVIDILTEMAPEEQRRVLEYVTGSPNLPMGGLGSLDPKFTIAKVPFPPGRSGSEMLVPTASISRNRLALPAYPTKELTESQLRQAVARDQIELSYPAELPG